MNKRVTACLALSPFAFLAIAIEPGKLRCRPDNHLRLTAHCCGGVDLVLREGQDGANQHWCECHH